MVGLENLKKEVPRTINSLLVSHSVPIFHIALLGNPGTGKTVMARTLAQIYYDLGILDKPDVVEKLRQDLVAKYMGQTEDRTNAAIKEAKGGVLFIDEAYNLASKDQGYEYGSIVINTLLPELENQRGRFLVIVAGYSKEMRDFMNQNPGLDSRFPVRLELEDPSIKTLMQIFQNMIFKKNKELASHDIKGSIAELLKKQRYEKGRKFGNTRAVRNIVDQIIKNQNDRLGERRGSASSISEEDRRTILLEDISNIETL
ncbi:AAA family ATPase [Endozoicomonas sp. SESOKO2]|uniref:AAA family ATPase n=1 Tax=Endozoicomonas sp. SESOKO2 TaxID=2828743 RepID=UPI002148812D|nr:AAA family ATPase [Endozoicomonas sp. SESOKO2]